jgi:hypothetical protein
MNQIKTPSALAAKLLSVALKEVGVKEKPLGSNRGPRVDKYQASTELQQKDWGAWCAAFVCWCMREAMTATGVKYSFKRMTTAAVRFMRAWSLRQDASTHTLDNPGMDIIPGDILIYGFSHTGIAKTKPASNGAYIAVEGNTNDDGGREGIEVAERPRHINSVRTRIRFTV